MVEKIWMVKIIDTEKKIDEQKIDSKKNTVIGKNVDIMGKNEIVEKDVDRKKIIQRKCKKCGEWKKIAK